MENKTLGYIKFFSGLLIIIYGLIELYYELITLFSSISLEMYTFALITEIFGQTLVPLMIGAIFIFDGMKDGE